MLEWLAQKFIMKEFLLLLAIEENIEVERISFLWNGCMEEISSPIVDMSIQLFPPEQQLERNGSSFLKGWKKFKFSVNENSFSIVESM